MSTGFIEVLDPVAPVSKLDTDIAPRLDTLDGKVIGLLDNSKPNFDIFLDHVEEGLRERFKLAGVVRVKKPLVGIPFDGKPMEDFASKVNAVVNGMCD